MDLNEPVYQDSSHPWIDAGMAGHVRRWNMKLFLKREEGKGRGSGMAIIYTRVL